MAYMDARRRKNGRTAYVVRWVDAETKESQYQKFDNVEDARFLLAILKAHQSDTAAALKSARDHYGGVYTVTQMIEDHIALLTAPGGYTIRRYKGYLRNHINGPLGSMDASKVEYRDIVGWIGMMREKGLSRKTIANVHGLISAAFNSAVREKKRQDNPCKGVALPKSTDTEEAACFLTKAEWEMIRIELGEPYQAFFTFLISSGLRFSEATALYARDFITTPNGQTAVKIVRAWSRDENNDPCLSTPKTRKSRRSVALNAATYALVSPLLAASKKSGKHVFLNTDGAPIDHRRAWGVWDRAVRKAQQKGLTKRPRIHDLRHTNASWLLYAGLSLHLLQHHLGHESITTTVDRYSHLLPESLSLRLNL
jgi:integrase